jgi:hypothetical protein
MRTGGNIIKENLNESGIDSRILGPGKVSGTIMLSDGTTGTNRPLSGIKVYLLNTNFKPDTVNYANNQAA